MAFSLKICTNEKQVRAHGRSAQNSIHEWKSILGKERFCSECPDVVLQAGGCDEHELDPPYTLASAEHSLIKLT